MTNDAPLKKAKKALASMRNQHMQAASSGLFSFDSAEQAEKLLARLRRNFVISKEQDADQSAPSLRLWVKGYALTQEQEKQGYLGHFAVVRIKRKAGGKWTLLMEPLDVPLASHPERKRPPKQHPDWGHPALRAVRRGKAYADIEAARRELLMLHEAFPEVSIPGADRLSIIVYRKRAGGGAPVEKVRLAIKPEMDKYTIIQVVKSDRAQPEPKAKGPEAVKGKFTALLHMKRKSRGNKA